MNPELEAMREENRLLRELARTHEVDRDTKEYYERLLTEIGKSIGCGHLDDRLPSCVVDALGSGKQAIDLLRLIYRRHDGTPHSIRCIEKFLATLGMTPRSDGG